MTTFISDPDRDATAVIRGFVYQVDVTIRRWLTVGEHEFLQLECGEDIDAVARGYDSGETEHRIVEQVKSLEANVTLRSPATAQSVAHFALHRERNPGQRLLFRFTTNAAAGTEHNSPFPASMPGIVAWERMRCGNAGEAEEAELASTLRIFYRSLERGTKVSVEAWNALKRFVEAADDEQWMDFVASFEWSVGSAEPATMPDAIREELIAAGFANSDNADDRYLRLFGHVFRLLTTAGAKLLTRQVLVNTLDSAPDPITQSLVVTILSRVSLLERRVDSHERRISDIEVIQRRLVESSQSVAQTHAQETEAIFGGMAAAVGGHGPNIASLLVSATTETPAPPARAFERATAVTDLRNTVQSGWLAIYGDTGSGKTQLARLFASSAPFPALWLRMTDLPSGVARAVMRRSFEHATSLAEMAPRDRLFREAFRESGPARLVVLDDLPRIDSRSPFADDLIALARCAKDAGAVVISTSLHHLPPAISVFVGDVLREVLAPPLSVAEVSIVLELYGAVPDVARAFAGLVETLSEGHVAIVVGIAQYLSSRNWIIGVDELVRLVAGEHAAGTRSELVARLLTSVVEAPTRQLLYRMMLAVGDVTFGEVCGLADAPPSIDRPRERLAQLEGLWVQVDGDRHIRVPPLVRLLPDDLPEDQRRFCNARLAAMRMHRGTLSPLDVVKVVTYFMKAGLDYQAGLALAQGFMELERLGPIPDAGLSDLFATWSLPHAMPNGIKLFVRGAQLGMRLRWKKDVEFVLKDLEAICDETTNAFERSAIMVATGKLITGDPAQAWRAFPFLRRAMAAHDEGRLANLPVVPIPDSIWMMSIFLSGYSIRSVDGLRELQRTVEELSPARRAALNARDDLEQMFVSITGNHFLEEISKPEGNRNWQAVVGQMVSIGKWSLDVGWPLLHAHAIRIAIIVLGEYCGDVEAVIGAGVNGSEENPDDRSKGIIEGAVGRQMNLRNRWSDARQWYARAARRPPTSIALLQFDILIGAANAEQEYSLPVSIDYLTRALMVADASDDMIGRAGQFSARAELAVAEILNGNRTEALARWDEAGAMLLTMEPKDDTERGLIRMFLQQSSFFYFSAAGLVTVMQLGPPDQRPVAPMIGQFHSDLREFGRGLDLLWRGRVSVMLGKIADARAERKKARTYGENAMKELGCGRDVPDMLLSEAQRLAALEVDLEA